MPKKQKTILLIEDDRDQQKMYRYAFTKAGYYFLATNDGIEGVKIAKKEKPGVILLDILMNNIGGIETLKLLKKDKETSSIPVVILTNYTKEETLKKAIRLGAKEIIIKTDVVPKELVIMIGKYF